MVEGVNHLFQGCITGYFDEYGNIEETISPKVLKIMLNWLEKMY